MEHLESPVPSLQITLSAGVSSDREAFIGMDDVQALRVDGQGIVKTVRCRVHGNQATTLAWDGERLLPECCAPSAGGAVGDG